MTGNPMPLEKVFGEPLERLQSGLRAGDLYHMEQAMLNPRILLDVMTPDEFDRLNMAMNRKALLMQLDAVARFVLEVLNTALVGQGENRLLSPVADEMNRLGEFPYLRALRTLLEPCGETRTRGDVVHRVPQQLPLGCDHDASPLNLHRALYTMLNQILGEGGGGSFSAAPDHNGKEAA